MLDERVGAIEEPGDIEGEHVLPIQTGGNFIVEHPANEQQRNCPSGIFTRLRQLAVRGQDRKHNRIRSEGGRFCWAVQMVDPRSRLFPRSRSSEEK
jgi:hypothetical protein